MADDYRAWLKDIERNGFRGYEVTIDWTGSHPKIYYQGRLVKGASGTNSDCAYGLRKAKGQLLRAIQEPPRVYKTKKRKRKRKRR